MAFSDNMGVTSSISNNRIESYINGNPLKRKYRSSLIDKWIKVNEDNWKSEERRKVFATKLVDYILEGVDDSMFDESTGKPYPEIERLMNMKQNAYVAGFNTSCEMKTIV